jgi:hypothetical protein
MAMVAHAMTCAGTPRACRETAKPIRPVHRRVAVSDETVADD